MVEGEPEVLVLSNSLSTWFVCVVGPLWKGRAGQRCFVSDKTVDAPQIDTSLVDSTCKIDEYDAETQGAIRKIMFDQKQKVTLPHNC